MTGTFEAVFANGVIRPINPVSLPNDQRLIISWQVADQITGPAGPAPLVSSDYQWEELPEEIEIPRIPLKDAGTVKVHFVYMGRMSPTPYPDDR